MQENMNILGLIAGMGDLPVTIATEAKAKGYTVFAVGLAPLVDSTLEKYVDEFRLINVGKLGAIIKAFRTASVQKAVMGGKVPKTLLYKSRIIPDFRALTLLLKLKDKKDDSILLAVTEEFKKEGIAFMDVTDFTSSLLTQEGVLTKKGLSKNEKRDIEFGFTIAKEIGRLDIGQTVVVKDQAVMAVEAIEGTDQAVLRGGEAGGEGAVVIKVSKPGQDKRFDFPAAGLETLASMVKAGARVLALEAGETLMVNKDQMIKEADKAGITIVGVSF